jgi:C4-type Zn-finger protein
MKKKRQQMKRTFCPNCQGVHDLGVTRDNSGATIGYFCHVTKEIISLNTTVWNGMDFKPVISIYLNNVVDEKRLPHLGTLKIFKLAKELSYRFMDTDIAQKYEPNYFFILYILHDELLKIWSKFQR